MNEPKISDRERAVLRALCASPRDFGFMSFRGISARGVPAEWVRRSTRSLSRKGLAEFGKGLCTDDGTFCGSGYQATEIGRALIGSDQ